MRLSWRYLLLFVVLIVLTGLAVIDFSLIKTYLIAPITQILWLIIRTVQSVDQQIYWIVLILVVFVFTLWIIPQTREAYKTPAKYLKRSSQENRVEYWETLLSNCTDDPIALDTLVSELKTLQQSLEPMSHGKGMKNTVVTFHKLNFWQNAQMKLEKLILNRFLASKKRRLPRHLEKSIDQILTELENNMEIQNDRPKNQTNEH